MLALSSRPWLGYSDQGKFNLVPMSYEPLDWACGERARGGARGCPPGRGTGGRKGSHPLDHRTDDAPTHLEPS